MSQPSLQQHWDTIYSTKDTSTEVSWYQADPSTSLDLITATGVAKNSPILDAGGGDALLVDRLLANGYTNVAVLDISPEALRKAQVRLGAQAQSVRWIAADVLAMPDDMQVDVWHDRAAFHFLTTPADISRYVANATRHIRQNGYLLLGTFSTRGPNECSGLPVAQYSEETIKQAIGSDFEHILSFEEDHTTPSHTTQVFLWSVFKRI